jgi:hypothetical protein
MVHSAPLSFNMCQGRQSNCAAVHLNVPADLASVLQNLIPEVTLIQKLYINIRPILKSHRGMVDLECSFT